MSKITPQRSSARSIGAKKPSLSALLVLAVILFNVMVPIVSAKSTLVSGEQLRDGEYLESPDRSKRFVVKDGKAIIQEKGIRNLQTWLLTPENDQGSDPSQYRIKLSALGILAGVNSNGKVTRVIRPESPQTQMDGAWELSLMNNGFLYLKNRYGVIVWNSICDHVKIHLDSNEILMDACLIAPDGSFLYMKANGNLVLYKGYTPLYSWSRLYQGGKKAWNRIFLYLTSTGTLKIVNNSTKTEVVLFNNDKPGVKEGRYRLLLGSDGKMLIIDSRGVQVALLA
ncbi:MAG: hypothetical protein J3Q66DRAFT_394082 [Benniella sp.]|nr:MAG: hypothetical protein J3Q66DRAFT_394082 [Benniella sp.]